MRHLLPLYVFLLFLSPAFAQPYVEGGRTSQRFAQTTIGLDAMFTPGGGRSAYVNSLGALTDFSFSPGITPRILISGLHFWGHADFYLAFPLRTLNLSKAPVAYRFNSGVETGARIFPWRIESGKLRPFAGISMNSTDFRQANREGDWGPWTSRMRVPVQAGVLYARGQTLVDVSMRWHWANSQTYRVDFNTLAEVGTPPVFFQAGVRRYFESTGSAEKGMQSGAYERLEKRLQERRALDGFSVAAGPSTAFFLQSSPTGSLGPGGFEDRLRPVTFPEFGLGYFFNGPDAHFNLAFRPMRARNAAYGYEQTATRTSLALEAFKFAGNYHGFVPFVGASVSREWLGLKVTEQGQVFSDVQRTRFHGGVTFGWDIRPTPVNTILLRTNLRWYPRLSPGEGIRFDQLEFNFIQVVWYPGRGRKIQAVTGGQ
jgi:hypothetical protein